MTDPSTSAKTNLMVADIALRSAGSFIRHDLEERMIVQSYDPQTAGKLADGRAILTSVMLYGASRLATKSKAGLALVVGGLVVKALYDRGKACERRGRDGSSSASG